MERIDFDKVKPDFINGDFKWYIDKHFQNYIENEQRSNLPKLQGIGCFVVKSIDIEDYVTLHNITMDNINEYRIIVEGEGKLIKNLGNYMVYSLHQLVQDGSYELVII